ncbi:MAG: hypothetical protein O3C43_18390 [Verrucomicrobia bacterium]|nr:hypothetical protein [Verrucomicrobiota bacterium]MDA1068459.1 hypothetical protein [Verrucomicrobiota bacterium]
MKKILSQWFLILSLLSTLGLAQGNDFSWRTEDSIEALHFETAWMSGMLVANDGRDLAKGFGKHGIRGLTFKGHDLSAPEPPVGGRRRHQGILNLYRVYSSTESFGSLRDEQAQVERLDDGARLTWPASDERPVTISGSWRITGIAQFDLLVEATPTRKISNFEILPAVYLAVLMDKSVYLEGNDGPFISHVRPNEDFGDPLNYAFYPLGEKARAAQENSGRIHSDWKWKSVVPKELAALPILFAEDDTVQVVLMADPESTSAVCATPLPMSGSPENWNSVEQHSALYFSTFGHDVEPGKTYTSRIRLVLLDKPSKSSVTHLELYKKFLAE